MKYCNRYVVQTIFGDFLLFKTKNNISRDALINSEIFKETLNLFGIALSDVIVSKSISKLQSKTIKGYDFQSVPKEEMEYLAFIKN